MALSALVVVIAVPAQSAVAATRISLWVSSSGTNTGNCRTKTTPCATITYALTQAPSTGTNINLLSNVADEVNINKDIITIQSSPTTSHLSIRPTTDTLTAQTPEGANVAPIVYVGPSRTGIALKNIAIDGSGRPPAGGCDAGKGHTGLYVRSAQVALTTTDVVGVTQGTGLTGCQNGGAIYVRTDTNQASNVKSTGGVVNTYDKNGITCNSVGTTCVISKTVVAGRGAVGIGDAAQNGIQFGFGATGSVTSVAVTGNNYTPDGEGTGILLYNAGTGVLIKSSNISGNNVGIYALRDGSAPAGQTTANVVLSSNKVWGNSAVPTACTTPRSRATPPTTTPAPPPGTVTASSSGATRVPGTRRALATTSRRTSRTPTRRTASMRLRTPRTTCSTRTR